MCPVQWASQAASSHECTSAPELAEQIAARISRSQGRVDYVEVGCLPIKSRTLTTGSKLHKRLSRSTGFAGPVNAEAPASYGAYMPSHLQNALGPHWSSRTAQRAAAQVVDAQTLEPVEDVRKQATVVAIAAFFGSVRLIDNLELDAHH